MTATALKGSLAESAQLPTRRGLLRRRPELFVSPVLFVVAIGVWEAATTSELLPSLVFSPPSDIASAFVRLLGESWFYEDVWVTTYETLVGFGLATVTAMVLAVAVTRSPLVRRFALPYIVFFQVLPKVVLAPVFIAWLGFGLGPKILLAAAISFFAVLSNTIKGIEQVPENAVRLMRSLDASSTQTYRMLVFPSALPYVLAGLRAAMTLSLIGAVVAEFVTARRGMGRLVTTFSANFQREEMWAATIAIGILGLLLYGSIAVLGRLLVRWRP